MASTDQQTITVLLADDYPLIRKGLRTLLESEDSITVTGEAGDGQEAIDLVAKLAPDMVIMDITMPTINGIEATRRILAEAPETCIIALSTHSEKHFVDEMFRAGARANLLKESAPEELIHAIRAVMQGESFLSTPILGPVIPGYQQSVDDVHAPQAKAAGPILQTKLHRPLPPSDLVSRTHLLEKLQFGLMRPLTLVLAPAGYGKSILISNWLETCCDWPSVWLSLDADDSNLRQFLSYFVAAIQNALPHACKQTELLINALQLPPFLTLLTSLSNDLEAIDQPFILVLDDYHRIDAGSPVNDLLHHLLKRPPIPLHLVIISRRDPPLQLVTLRAQEQITEIRMLDLCFTPEESRLLFKKTLGFTITDDALTNLQQVIEGWIAGLRLLTLAQRQSKDRDGFLKGLHGGIQLTQKYLAHEVISQQSPLMQSWLVKSAILNRFCESLIQAVCTGETSVQMVETSQGAFIESVVADNLFVIPLDNEGQWFRYHHQFQQLLQDELRRRMAPDETARLHLLASEWFVNQSLIEEAVQHALLAGDDACAADIIEQHQQSEFDRDRWFIVERWLSMLPPKIIQQRPRLLLAQAWGLYNTHKMLEIPPLLEKLESLLVNKSVDESLLGEINFYRGFMLTVFEGDAEGALIELKTARKRLSRLTPPVIAGEVEVLAAVASQMVGEERQAIRYIDQEIKTTYSWKGLVFSRLVSGPVFIHLLSGNLPAVIPAAQRFTAVCRKSGIVDSDSEIWSRYLRANADFQSYHLDEALLGFQYVAEKRDFVHRKAAIEAQAGLVLTYQTMQCPEAAVHAMKQLMAFAEDTEEQEHLVVAQSCRARLLLLQENLKPAIDWARSFNEEAHAPSMLMWLETPVITRLKVIVATGNFEGVQLASALLVELSQSAEAVHNTYHVIEIMVLQSIALERLGRKDDALKMLQRVIKLAEPGIWIWPFVELGRPMAKLLECLVEQKGVSDYLQLLLDKLPTNEKQSADTTVAGYRSIQCREIAQLIDLTRCELDILQLLTQRLQNKEIADLLFVSPETVKTHLKHLYQKLDVHSRREAVDKAVEITAAGTIS
jgi:LuxR family maltose regulon positive regulatory protein